MVSWLSNTTRLPAGSKATLADLAELLPVLPGQGADPVEFFDLDFEHAVLARELDDLLGGREGRREEGRRLRRRWAREK